jgi:UDP-N-acetylmuramyl tripeptide synthase
LDGTIAGFSLPNRGLHYALDSIAALASAKSYLAEAFDLQLAAKVLDELPPVFARGEIAQVNGEDVEFILVQNPMSFQLNLDNLTTKPEQIMVAIGRDVHDPSWLWTVDMSNLSHADVVSGYNFAEIALRLTYAGVPIGNVDADLESALAKFFALPVPSTGMKTVIFSADAMRRTRRILGFTDPEAVER